MRHRHTLSFRTSPSLFTQSDALLKPVCRPHQAGHPPLLVKSYAVKDCCITREEVCLSSPRRCLLSLDRPGVQSPLPRPVLTISSPEPSWPTARTTPGRDGTGPMRGRLSHAGRGRGEEGECVWGSGRQALWTPRSNIVLKEKLHWC